MEQHEVELTIDQLQDEISALEAKKAELAKALEVKRDAEKSAAFAEIIMLMADHGISVQELVESFGATMPRQKAKRSRATGIKRSWVHPGTGTVYVKGAIPKALQEHMRSIGWSGSFRAFREQHMSLAS